MFESLKKASQLALLPASIPDPAPIVPKYTYHGLNYEPNRGNPHEHAGHASENPLERAVALRDAAMVEVEETRQLHQRALALLHEAVIPGVGSLPVAVNSSERIHEARRIGRIFEEATIKLRAANFEYIAALERFQLKLRGQEPDGDVHNPRPSHR